MKKTPKSILYFVFLFAIFTLGFVQVSADAGPKPSVTIIVENSGGANYYLDLLVPYEGEYPNIQEDERADYDMDMLEVLEDYEQEGWYAALVHGTNAPLFGDLTGTPSGDSVEHRFSYIIPNTFKIAIVDSDLDIKVSEQIQTRVFNETIYLDYETMQLRRVQPGILTYLRQFVLTFIPTIVIEGILLLLFGFSLKKNWKVFILLNLLTQVLLTVAMSVALINFGLLTAFFIFIPAEIVIFIIEAAVLIKMLKEHRTSRRLIFALTANIASAVLGFFLVPTWFEFIFR